VAKHHPEQQDCIGCHMPREKSSDVAHEQVTDHRIQTRPIQGPVPQGGELTVVGGGTASDRDLGLAYFELAERGSQTAGQRAKQLLEQSGAGDSDTDVHTDLGLLDQVSGDAAAATREYQKALKANPADSVAAGDLAILQARTGDLKDAVAGLTWVSTHDPSDTGASLDLAMIQCAIGDPQAAIKTLEHLIQFSPDDQKARAALAKPCSH
jgi:Flp pilus assembly protein TadD